MKNKSLEIKIWNKTVGYLAEDIPGKTRFEYDPSFLGFKWEISPGELPLLRTGIYESRNISPTYRGLPGIIADCLPDRFGMRAIETFFAKQFKMDREEISVLDRLLYVGDRSIGALEFRPAIEVNLKSKDYLNLENLVQDTKRLLEGDINTVPLEIIRMSASPGGRVAKALIDYSPSENKIRSGFADPKNGFIPCIIKFDGVSDGDPPNEYGRLEYIYSKLARNCGINMPNTYLIEGETPSGPGAHFIVERFDRNEKKEKVCHYGSLCGLFLRDFMEKHSCSYEEYLRFTQSLCANQKDVEEALRRMLFNLMFRNQDDHTKNLGFVMNRTGDWNLAPAFDLNYVFGFGLSATHQMTLFGKDDDFDKQDLIKAAKVVGISSKKVNNFISSFSEAAKGFTELGLEAGLDIQLLEGIKSKFRAF